MRYGRHGDDPGFDALARAERERRMLLASWGALAEHFGLAPARDSGGAA